MNRFWIFSLIVLLVSCSEAVEESTSDVVSSDEPAVMETPDVPDMDIYVDANLADVSSIRYGGPEENPTPVYVTINDEEYEVLKYEGQMTAAYATSDGVDYMFEPYDYYDEEMEETVKSKYQFTMQLSVNDNQESYLGYYANSAETKNIKWDYFENLFIVYFYLNEDLQNIPLKILNEGKTEWDG